ncbi:uncharacterized protein LOC122364014 [Amphibalanus amphitrite]|uniref:uncharacterized protein LOC122364014 n=1 Tax=Amphibalanus amphitrite TaxID=1232801 RepID=UPI001C8FD0A7|nr:uncharacterized protein LOC122364014 [Amphibalanus amphitrite]
MLHGPGTCLMLSRCLTLSAVAKAHAVNLGPSNCVCSLTTEAHPMDPAALACCSGPRLDDILQEITDDPRHRRFKLFGGRPVRPRPPPVATAVCRQRTLQELIAELASPRRLSDAARADSEQRCLRHLEIMRDPAAERSYERLRCDRPPFEDRLLVLNEVFTS